MSSQNPVAELSERKKWKEAGLRYGMRESRLTQKAVSAILNGEPVKVRRLKRSRVRWEAEGQVPGTSDASKRQSMLTETYVSRREVHAAQQSLKAWVGM